jgi:hypothetical protein
MFIFEKLENLPILDDYLCEFKNQNFSNKILEGKNEKYCSDEYLHDIIKIDKIRGNKKYLNLIFNKTLSEKVKNINDFLSLKHTDKKVEQSGHFLYPKNGCMGWHTNSNSTGLRCYINYSENGDSYFKYYDMEQNKTYTTQDNIGWSIRYFDVYNDPNKYFWHCVYSNTNRISIGFRIINNLLQSNSIE